MCSIGGQAELSQFPRQQHTDNGPEKTKVHWQKDDDDDDASNEERTHVCLISEHVEKEYRIVLSVCRLCLLLLSISGQNRVHIEIA